jgi:hypothetical protein
LADLLDGGPAKGSWGAEEDASAGGVDDVDELDDDVETDIGLLVLVPAAPAIFIEADKGMVLVAQKAW